MQTNGWKLFVVMVMGATLPGAALAQDPMPAAGAEKAEEAAKPVVPTIESANGDVAVATVIDSKPTTPAQLLRAAATLADLGRADLGKAYLQQLAAANVSEAALAEAATQIAPDLLMRISANEALRPEGRTLAAAVLAAGAKQFRNPERLRGAIDRLADRSRAVQREAMIQILAAREDAVPALLIALADGNRAATHPLARQALVQIGDPAVAPLAAALQTDNDALKVQIIDVLEQIQSRDAVPYLVGPAVVEGTSADVRRAAAAALKSIQNVQKPTAADAEKLLAAEIQKYLRGDRPLVTDADGKSSVWQFDRTAGVPVREIVPADEAAAIVAARLADDLKKIASGDANAERLYLVCHLQAAAMRAGPFQPLPAGNGSTIEAAKKFGAEAIEDALTTALAEGLLPAAKGAAQALGDVGDASFLQATGEKVRPIVNAVSHGDRQLRFTAAEAMVKWHPESGFAGSSDLVAALAWFAGAPGERRALVAFPNERIASELATMLGALGYQVDTVTNGRNAYLQLLSSGDYELALLSGRLDHPPLATLIQELRRSPRTAKLPILFLAEDGDGERLRSLAVGDARTATIERPVTPQAMKLHVDRLTQRSAGDVVPAELRSQQALASLEWLKQLNETLPKEYDIRQHEAAIRHSLYSPAHSAAAAELLALIGTHTAQKTLVDLAGSATLPIGMRQTAAAAFSRSVRRYGVQLTSDELRQQYRRYNASEIEDADSQQLLALVLDAIELPRDVKAEGKK